ncbi:MAG: hypothetical protein K6U04_06820 [Armatimonadetes bacterium]|nr:hypothetical protein [Armatimonadota bacterium]
MEWQPDYTDAVTCLGCIEAYLVLYEHQPEVALEKIKELLELRREAMQNGAA